MKTLPLLLASALLPLVGFAQIAHVQSVGTVGTSLSISPKAAGDLLIVFAGSSNASDSLTVTDSLGNTWMPLNPPTSQSGEGIASSWCAIAKAPGSDRISIHGVSSSWSDVLVDEFSGVGSFDAVAQVTGSGSPDLPLSLSQPGEVVWAAALGTLTGVGSGFTRGANDKSQDWSEYAISAATNIPVAFGNTGNYILLAASFLPTGTVQPPPPPPTITNFSASPGTVTAGDPVVLSWTTSGATSVSIGGLGTEPASGSITTFPTQTTTYTLTASNAGGSVTQAVTVTVTDSQPPPTVLTAGTIICSLQNNGDNTLGISCTAQGSPAYSGTLQHGVTAFTFQVNQGADALTVILSPLAGAGWNWNAAANDVASNGTL